MRKISIGHRLLLIPKVTFAAMMGGAAMAVLNFLFLLARGDSSYRFKNLHTLISWHILIWIVLGLVGGTAIVLLSFLKSGISRIKTGQLIVAAFLISLFLIVQSYINIYALPYIFSLKSLVINFIFIFVLGTAAILAIKKIKNMSKWAVIALGLLFLLLWSSSYLSDMAPHQQSYLQKKSQKPSSFNILMIVLDATRPDHLGCYGYHRDTSPRIDRVASKGILFTKAFAHASRTYMSVPSLFTSTYPSTHGVIDGLSVLPKDCLTLPAFFHSVGYSTALFSTNPHVSTVYGYGPGVDELYEPVQNILKKTFFYKLISLFISKSAFNKTLFSFTSKLLDKSCTFFRLQQGLLRTEPDQVTSKIISWISQHQSHPFFLYVHYEGGHAPYRSPLSYQKYFSPDYQGRQVDDPNLLTDQERRKLTSQELEHMIALYDSKIKYHDDQLDRLFKFLEMTGLDKKTIVVLTADHGEELGEHGHFLHASLYNDNIQVPLILYNPRLFPSHRVIGELFGQVDLFPTLISLAGIKEKPRFSYKIEGMDFSPYLLNMGDRPRREYIFSEVNIEDRQYRVKIHRSIRTRDYQAIQVQVGLNIERLLFDLNADPQENKNIAVENPEVGRKLFETMESVYKLSLKKSFSTKKAYLDEATKERLRSLGYIH
ncbi:MAG: sulfatase [Candidatus Aminicenantales bacterium]